MEGWLSHCTGEQEERGQNIQWKHILQMFKGVVRGHTVIQGLTGYYRAVLQSLSLCYIVLHGFTVCCRVLEHVTGCYRVLQGVGEFNRGITCFYFFNMVFNCDICCYSMLQFLTWCYRESQNIKSVIRGSSMLKGTRECYIVLQIVTVFLE